MESYFKDLNLDSFWEDCEYSKKEYVNSPITRKIIELTEKELGYKLPDSYIELMTNQNGGIPVNQCYPTDQRTSWAEDHVAISGIFALGSEKAYSLCGELGSKFMIDEWGYPEIGVYFGDCPSAGHDMICLDYRVCGRFGIPKVVHVDQESDYKITPLADTFEEFISGLVHDSIFDEGETW
ncbi:SMI1/KNR4 family protein (plasmid) [Saccharobesus litoralis]|uniref:SMI1/KNR4 family protein n=1 Tax=Saccharobesus litoralis TaxID=2172099 RepID=A0A2S0VY23_9ALTE|nr:SMI1/KNR4 family protein [Saccharobesus litoralis]AWB69126.1 SMI1/KNR4 family protein [Saccharobesus litoralis]